MTSPTALANLRALAEAAHHGPWVNDARTLCDLEGRKLIDVRDDGGIGSATAEYIAAVSPGVVLGLLDALATYRDDSVEVAAAWEAIGADLTGDLPTAIRTMREASGAHVRRVEAERDELAAEVLKLGAAMRARAAQARVDGKYAPAHHGYDDRAEAFDEAADLAEAKARELGPLAGEGA